MDEEFIRQRITQLRIRKNVSEYKMSLDLGHSKGYIQSISSGRALPSMSEFLAICDYLDITPHAFFEEAEAAALPREVCREFSKLNRDDSELLLRLARRLKQ